MLKEEIENFIKDKEAIGVTYPSIQKQMPSFIARSIAEQNELIDKQNKSLENIEKALWAICRTMKANNDNS